MSTDYQQQNLAMQGERDAVVRLDMALEIIRGDLSWYWGWGDGEGGYIFARLCQIAYDEGFEVPREYDPEPVAPPAPKKRKINGTLRRLVFERDAYRCKECTGFIDLCCDHIVPESLGGATTFDNLQTLCRPCNSRKGTKVPA